MDHQFRVGPGSALESDDLAVGKGEALRLQSDNVDEQRGEILGARLLQVFERIAVKRPRDRIRSGEQACRTRHIQKKANLPDQRVSSEHSHPQRRQTRAFQYNGDGSAFDKDQAVGWIALAAKR